MIDSGLRRTHQDFVANDAGGWNRCTSALCAVSRCAVLCCVTLQCAPRTACQLVVGAVAQVMACYAVLRCAALCRELASACLQTVLVAG